MIVEGLFAKQKTLDVGDAHDKRNEGHSEEPDTPLVVHRKTDRQTDGAARLYDGADSLSYRTLDSGGLRREFGTEGSGTIDSLVVPADFLAQHSFERQAPKTHR